MSDKRLRSKQQTQAVRQRQRENESEQQERHRLHNESWNQWKAIRLWFNGWAKRNILGDELPGYQSDKEFAANIETLLNATKAHYGSESVTKVAGFEAEVYRTDAENQERYFHAVAVEWILELLNDANESEDVLAAVSRSKESLSGYSSFELEIFATRLQQAAKVIRMGAVDRFCARCGKRLSVNCFDVAECCSEPLTPNEEFVTKHKNYTLKRNYFNDLSSAFSWRDEAISVCRSAENLGFEAPDVPDRELSEDEAMRIIENLVRKVDNAELNDQHQLSLQDLSNDKQGETEERKMCAERNQTLASQKVKPGDRLTILRAEFPNLKLDASKLKTIYGTHRNRQNNAKAKKS